MSAFHSPLSAELLAYWHRQQHGAPLPTTEDFFDHVPPRLAPLLILFEHHDGALIVRYLGTQLVERWHEDLTGKNWLGFNRHLNAKNLLANFMTITQHPCGGCAQSSFITTTGRELNIETFSLPLAVRAGRPARIISGSFALETMGFAEEARGWMAPRALQWINLGFGVPAFAPKSPGEPNS
ncbi:MAG: PAS domain-containing protein [Rhodospirillaceae bacterium]|nr:PAS domain-containing protein [Rhodospirillaceae bacterium]